MRRWLRRVEVICCQPAENHQSISNDVLPQNNLVEIALHNGLKVGTREITMCNEITGEIVSRWVWTQEDVSGRYKVALVNGSLGAEMMSNRPPFRTHVEILSPLYSTKF